ncbi:VCBS repeat-containing protein [Compostibacter hankyongensis]|uniref:VCBS repeat-containing protein n=1 Tax=Compostibacter hankyongensis TaxID=1007089 RepID=A0ABP8FJE7_9BACT
MLYRNFLKIPAILTLFLITAVAVAQERRPPGFQLVEYRNPDAVADLGAGLWAQPLPMDYDGDGKTDLLVSCSGVPYNGIYFFRNSAGGKLPVFEKPVRLSDGIKDLQIAYVHGQPDLMVPGALIRNFSVSFGQERETLFSRDTLLKAIKKIRADQWKRVDYDGDGDLDIVAGLSDWGDYGWDNAFDADGRWRNGPLHGYVYLIGNEKGRYVNRGKLTTRDGRPVDQYGAPSPNFADFDGDGDLDLICGEFLDKLTWFENTGTRTQPAYAPGRLLVSGRDTLRMPLEMINPVAMDWDKDGDIDLIIGQEDGRVAFLENTGQVRDHMPVFRDPVFFRQKADKLKFGVLSTPFSADWDGDGREDIICGNSAGNIAFIRNLGGTPPKWAPPVLLQAGGTPIRIMAGPSGSIQGPAEAKWGYTTLTVADWDGDGRKDLIVNSIWGKVTWYKNTGTPQAPQLSPARPVKIQGPAPKPAWNWWNPEKNELVTQWRTTPFATDWNKDGRMDLIMLDPEGYLCFFERTPQGDAVKPGKRIFYGKPHAGFDTNNAVTDSLPGPLRLNTGKYGGSGRRKFCIVDWDHDGRPDLLVNSRNISFMRNTGIKGDTMFFEDKGPLTGDRLAGHTTSPAIVDWNKDGVPDLLVGAEDGHFYYLLNPHKP